MALRLRVVTGKITDAKGVPIQNGQVTFTLTEPLGYTSTHVVVDPFVFATTDALGDFSISLWADEDSLTPVNYTVRMPIVNSGPASATHQATISLAYEAGTPKDIGTLIAESQPPPSEVDDAVWRDLIDSRIDLAVINDLADVVITGVADDQVLTWDSATSKWVNQAPGGGGGIIVGTTTSNGTANTLLKTNATGQVGNATGLTNTATNQLTATAQAATDVPLTVKGAAAQSGNLQQWQNSAGSVLSHITSSGEFASTTGDVAISSTSVATTRFTVSGGNGRAVFDYNGNRDFVIEGQSGFIKTRSDGQFQWASGTDAVSSPDTGLARQSAGVIRATNGSAGISGFFGGGAAVASAAALPLPTGRVFHVTGATNITSITSTNFLSGAVITLIFDGVLTFTDGSNLVLAGNFVTTAGDTITLVYDGTNWHEIARSVN